MADEILIQEKLELFKNSFVNNFCIYVITYYDFLKEIPVSSDTGSEATTVNGKLVWLPKAARKIVIGKLKNLMSNLTETERTHHETWLKNASSNKILLEVACHIFRRYVHEITNSSNEAIIENGNLLAVRLFKTFILPDENSPNFDVMTIANLIVNPHPTDDYSILYCMNFNLYSTLSKIKQREFHVPQQLISGTKLTTSDINIILSAMKGEIKKSAKELRENLKCDVLTKVIEEMNYINDVPTATKELEKKEEEKKNILQQGNVQQNAKIDNVKMSFHN